MRHFSILASADHHWCVTSPRHAECLRIHRWMVQEARLRKPDVAISCGDLYEGVSTPADREAVAEWVTAMADICPLVVAKGNHDRPLDLSSLRRLRTRYPVHVVESWEVVHVGDAAIGVVAWPNRASLAAMLPGASAETLDEATGDAFRKVLGGIGDSLATHEGPRILAGHWQIDGAVTSTGQPLVGGGMRIGLADLALAQADIVLSGHIHKPQEWVHGGTEIVMCGSPFRTAFGEVEEKSVVRARWEHWDGEVTEPGARRWALESWSRVPTPATPMLLFTAAWRPETGMLSFEGETAPVGGAEVRLRYTAGADQRSQAKAFAEKLREAWLVAGALHVKVEEEVVPVTRARAPEVARASTLEEQLAAYWTARGVAVDPARARRIFTKLGEI